MSRSRNWKHAAGVAALTLTFLLLAASNGLAQHYQRTDLTTDNSNTSPTAPNVDPNLVNAWGMSRSSGSPWWISDNGTSLSTLYDSTGAPKSLVVSIPRPDGTPGGAPTGTVFNYTGAFEVASGQSAFFLWATEDGSISGWNPNVNPTSAIVKVNHSATAIYKGLALANSATLGSRLYATNFKSGAVEVFDGHFHPLKVVGGFIDASLPLNYAPFGIQNVGGN